MNTKMHQNLFYKEQYNAIILGGGISGVSLALRLAEKKKKVLIIEQRPSFCWEITSAFQNQLFENESLFDASFRQSLLSAGGLRNNLIDPPIFEILVNRMLKRKNIDILLYSYPLELITKDELVIGVIIGSKNGIQVIKGNLFVDATENAVLWKQTNVDFEETQTYPVKQRIVFNGIEKRVKFPLIFENVAGVNNISVYPSVWKKEAYIEFTIPEHSISSVRLKLIDVISFVRKNIPALKSAIVTHTGFEPFPLDTSSHLKQSVVKNPYVKNLFGCGLWIIPDKWIREKNNTITGRMQLAKETAMSILNSSNSNIAIHDELFAKLLNKNRGEREKKDFTLNSDVIVAGGGTAGALAGISAGRKGVQTTIIEAGTALGGIGTCGGIHIYYYGTRGGLQDEIDSRVSKISSLFAGKYKVTGFHPEAKKFVLEQMCKEANVEVIYGSTVFGVKIKNHHICGLSAVNSKGKMNFKGKVIIDSTGDGDVASMSGVPFIIGRETDEIQHTYSQPVGHLDENGKMEVVNFDSGIVDTLDIWDLTKARCSGIIQYYKKSFNEENRLLYIAPLIGIRQSRQITGDYQLTLLDQVSGKRFADCISYTTTHYDNHLFD